MSIDVNKVRAVPVAAARLAARAEPVALHDGVPFVTAPPVGTGARKVVDTRGRAHVERAKS